jgi:hypothetical protein
MVVVMPAAVGEDEAATQGQRGEYWNQPGDSTEHFKNPHGWAVLKPKLFIGCNMRPRPRRLIPAIRYEHGMQTDTNRIHSETQELAMTNKQRLKYSILIAVSVLAIMLGLSWLQNAGKLSEQMFQYIAIGVAVVVVVINGVMRRKVKP